MNFGVGLRALSYLKRIALAMERHSVAMESLLRIETDRWAHEQGIHPPPKKIVYTSLNQEAANKDWERRQRLEER